MQLLQTICPVLNLIEANLRLVMELTPEELDRIIGWYKFNFMNSKEPIPQVADMKVVQTSKSYLKTVLPKKFL